MSHSGGIVLVGGGLASQRCAETLRARGYDGRVRMICAENERPYDRPPLSKGVLAADLATDSLGFRDPGWYEEHGVELLLGSEAATLDPRSRTVRLKNGSAVDYEKLLIATGSRARRLPALEGFSNVQELRTLGDAVRLREALEDGGRLAIIGGGFIGQEVAASARSLGLDVTIIEALPLPLAPIFGDHVGRWLVERHREHGVEVLTSTRIARARGNGRVEELELEGGGSVECGSVLIGIGVTPSAEWIRGSGVDPEGIRTDPAGRTALPDVFAAGDVARPFDPRFGVHSRTEHWEAAARQGMAVARAMLGEDPGAPPLPSFWSDQYGMRIQYVGHAEHSDAVDVEPAANGRDLALVYRRAGRPIAALVVDRPRDLIARRREIELFHGQNTQLSEGGKP